MTQEVAAKKDIQRLQRAIVDGLEDVKAHDIAVFNTEHMSPLFERVIVASGTSNRQTKALAASVRDAVRESGFPKPRIEGEENGEWIIVDCGAAVAHIMQPAIRTYYHLEEIWGEKPVRVKFGSPRPAMPSADPEPEPAKKTAGKKTSAKKSAKTSAKKSSSPTARQPDRSAWTNPGKAAATTAGKSAGKSANKTAGKTAAGKGASAGGSRTPAKKAATSKATVRTVPARAPAKKTSAKKSSAPKRR